MRIIGIEDDTVKDPCMITPFFSTCCCWLLVSLCYQNSISICKKRIIMGYHIAYYL